MVGSRSTAASGRVDQLRDAQADAVEDLQQRRHAAAVAALGLRVASISRSTSTRDSTLGSGRPSCGESSVLAGSSVAHALGQQEAEELADHRQPARHRARRHADIVERLQVGAQRVGVGRRRLLLAPRQKGLEVLRDRRRRPPSVFCEAPRSACSISRKASTSRDSGVDGLLLHGQSGRRRSRLRSRTGAPPSPRRPARRPRTMAADRGGMELVERRLAERRSTPATPSRRGDARRPRPARPAGWRPAA